MRWAPAVVAVMVAAGAAGASAHRLDAPPALVGGDYYDTDCFGGHNLLKSGSVDAALERAQLFAMHAAGLNSLRYTINYTSDANLLNGGHGGAIPIGADGAMIEPYRSRFIQYLTDAKDAGFADVTIAFYPYGPNSPQPWTTGENIKDWDPSLYGADWGFVQDVHDLATKYGPAQTHFDLMAEGPASDYDRNNVGGLQIDAFIERLYSDYVTKYGAGDVFFTSIAKETGDQSRLVNLIEDLEATGRPLPAWWGLDIEYTGEVAARNLADADAIMRAFGVGGVFVLGETAYESADLAAAVQSYNASTDHPVVQVEEYPNLGTPECVNAPFTGDAYLNVLGIEPGPLLGRVDANGRPTLTTSDGVPVHALVAGRSYSIVVTDASKKAGFRVSAPGLFRRQTSAAFRGTVTWSVGVAGSGWTYASVTGKKVRSVAFVVLGA